MLPEWRLQFANLANTPYYSRPIRRIQDFDESKDYCPILKNTPYPHQRYAVYNTLVKEEQAVFNQSSYPSRRYSVSVPTLHRIPPRIQAQYVVNMDDPNITMEEYIRLEEEKARRR
nr:hypothetical protein [Tanacetum cinerariifolium]